MAKTLCSQCRGYWFDPKPENKILQATTKTQYYQNKLIMLLNKYIFFNVKKKKQPRASHGKSERDSKTQRTRRAVRKRQTLQPGRCQV